MMLPLVSTMIHRQDSTTITLSIINNISPTRILKVSLSRLVIVIDVKVLAQQKTMNLRRFTPCT